MAPNVSAEIAQRTLVCTPRPAQPAQSEPVRKLLARLSDITTAPDRSAGVRAKAGTPGKILAKMQGQMSAENFARFCTTLQQVKKGAPPPQPVKTLVPSTLPRMAPRTYEKSVSLHSGAIPVPPPPPPPMLKAQSLSMPVLPKAGWEKVKGASLDEATAGFKQHYAKKSAAKTSNGADKPYGDMLAQLRDVLAKRVAE